MVHHHGDTCVGLIFVRKGRLAFSALSEEGREVTILRAGAGQTCILSAACVFRVMESESHITAEVNTEVAILPAMILSQLMNQNPDVERIVYKQATMQYSGALKTLQQIVFFSLENVSPCSCGMRESIRRPQSFPPPMSRSPGASVPPERWSPGCSTSFPPVVSSLWDGAP